jgi:hypothetical protein
MDNLEEEAQQILKVAVQWLDQSWPTPHTCIQMSERVLELDAFLGQIA